MDTHRSRSSSRPTAPGCTCSQPSISLPRMTKRLTPGSCTSTSVSSGSHRSSRPPCPLALTAMLPATRKARPPNIFRSLRSGSPPKVSRRRRASSSSYAMTSAEAKAEGVTCRVEEAPERGARLLIGLGPAEGEDRLLTPVEVVDDDVEVHLLGRLLSGPLRRPVVGHLLERDAVAAVGRPDLHPFLLRLDVPVQEAGVERRERVGVGAVDDEGGEPCDGHDRTLGPDTDRAEGCGRK